MGGGVKGGIVQNITTDILGGRGVSADALKVIS